MGLFRKKDTGPRMIIEVPEMSCGHCEAAVTKALTPLQGVQNISVDLNSKTVTLETEQPGQPPFETIQEALQETPYTAVLKQS